MINLNSPIQTHKHMSSALFIESKYSENVRKRTLSQKIEFGMTSLTFFTIILIAIVSLVYLAHANRNATKGYALKNLELKRSQLITENEVWDMQISQVKSLQALENDPKIRTMVKAEQPLFVRGDTAIAAK
jgi:cell division protein FtsL